MSSWTPTRSTASARSNDSIAVPPNRAYQNAFGSMTPTARKAGIRSPAAASPQVKQRLAELRRAKLAAATANNNSSGSIDGATSPTDEESSPLDAASVRRPSSSASSLSLDSKLSLARTPSPAASEVTIELGIRSLEEELEKAKKTGRLNVAGRSLEELPPLVFEQLLPHNSVYHPSNAGPPKVFSSLIQKTADIDLSRTEPEDDDTRGSNKADIPWWEMESLTTLKASNNELPVVPAALAGFEFLEILDLHANKLAVPFPASFSTLANLTNLNLSNNDIDAWPIELMALLHLKVLDLSHNRVTKLWDMDWKTGISQRMKDFKRDTKRLGKEARGQENGDSSFDSIDSQSTAAESSAGEDFWSAFATAPVKTRARAYMPTKTDTDYTVALPSLVSLNLSHNKLGADSFSACDIAALPPALICLDLSSNNISGRIPSQLFSSLAKLQKLYLGNNGLDDAFFIRSLITSGPIFPSMEILDLSRNALDSLEHLEEVLRIPAERQAIYKGIPSPSLAKALAAIAPSSPVYTPLHIDLTSNFLREEVPRRKQLRREKRQETSSIGEDAGTPQLDEKNEIASVFRLLDEVHQDISDKLRQGGLSANQLSEIRASLIQLQAIAAHAENGSVNAPDPANSKGSKHPGSSLRFSQNHTPRKDNAQEIPGSSRARRQKLEQEAQGWAPL